MRKILKSGTVCMGICGKPTSLTDSFGRHLFVGDLVNLYAEIPNKTSVNRETEGPEYVVVDDDGNPFIMGIKGSLCRVTNYYLNGEDADEANYDYSETYYMPIGYPEMDLGYKWFVVKIKSYQDTVHGECWGSGNVTTCLEPEEKEAGTGTETGWNGRRFPDEILQ